jgi:hypothetical protein
MSSTTTAAAAAAYLVTADAEEQSRKRRPRRWWRRKMFCSGDKHRDVLFTEFIFNDGSYSQTLLGCQSLILIICCNLPDYFKTRYQLSRQYSSKY